MADQGKARYSPIQPVTARYSARKTYHVLYFQKIRRFGDIKYDTMRGCSRGLYMICG